MSRPLVLCYHAVAPEWDSVMSLPPAVVERQLESLLDRRFRPVAAAEALDGAGRVLHVTFDDAYRSVATALPILERLRIPATVFACTDLAADGAALDIAELAGSPREQLRTLDWAALAELAEQRIEIGSHTRTHAHLTRCSDAELDRELRESRTVIEDSLGRACRFLAYPFGEHDARVRAAARRAGYEGAFALGFGGLGRPDRYAWPRVGLYPRDRGPRFALKTRLY